MKEQTKLLRAKSRKGQPNITKAKGVSAKPRGNLINLEEPKPTEEFIVVKDKWRQFWQNVGGIGLISELGTCLPQIRSTAMQLEAPLGCKMCQATRLFADTI